MGNRNARRITLVISSLQAGGAERVVATHANYWATKGWNITIITCAPESQRSFYELHPGVEHVNVDFGVGTDGIVDGIRKNFRRNVMLRRAIQDSTPDCIVSHLHVSNIRTIIASLGLKVPVIITEHSWGGYFGLGLGWDLKCSNRHSNCLKRPTARGRFHL